MAGAGGASRPASRLVVGAAQLGQSYGRSGRPAPTESEVQEILTRAVGSRCAAVDTARAYGDSEASVGAARKAGVARDLPIVTKIRPLAGDEPGRVAASTRLSLAESLAALRAERVEVVLLHRAEDLTRADGAAVGTLRAAHESGLIGMWGVSASDPDELIAALAVPDLGHVQLPFNLLDRRWLRPDVQAALAARPDVTIVARSVFLQGLLLHPEPGMWPDGTEPTATAVSVALSILSAETGRMPAGLCIGYALAQPWIDAVVVGIRSAQQLTDVVDECARPPLSCDECEQVIRALPGGSPNLINPALWPQMSKETT
ncbi:aldo/keto reductase [Microbacterium sp. NEAU-LLC]|uniref:Aldo/keto reductase n=1 Tax=Microbacterium helvum TaxID=2773713 RepID=A0ABR8NPU5_9MICO|nr:aldo/keto reductase [Microbacterium helvum]MBD3942672.1 aldo/keto reductase [Microbacterium helvum]